jgi:hypothetical protein
MCEETFMENEGPFIIITRIHGDSEIRVLPKPRRKGPVKAEKFGMIVQIGAYMFTFSFRNGFPFGAEQSLGCDGFDSGAVRKTAVS